jgi:hypothetical protein
LQPHRKELLLNLRRRVKSISTQESDPEKDLDKDLGRGISAADMYRWITCGNRVAVFELSAEVETTSDFTHIGITTETLLLNTYQVPSISWQLMCPGKTRSASP